MQEEKGILFCVTTPQGKKLLKIRKKELPIVRFATWSSFPRRARVGSSDVHFFETSTKRCSRSGYSSKRRHTRSPSDTCTCSHTAEGLRPAAPAMWSVQGQGEDPAPSTPSADAGTSISSSLGTNRRCSLGSLWSCVEGERVSS